MTSTILSSENSGNLLSKSTSRLYPRINVRMIYENRVSRDEISSEMLPLSKKIAQIVARDFTANVNGEISIQVDALRMSQRHITILFNNRVLGPFRVTAFTIIEAAAPLSTYVNILQLQNRLAEARRGYTQLNHAHNLVKSRIENCKRSGKRDAELKNYLEHAAQLVNDLSVSYCDMQALYAKQKELELQLFESEGLFLKIDDSSVPRGDTIWQHFDALTNVMIKTVPEIPIRHHPLTVSRPIAFDYNNYGLKVTSYMEYVDPTQSIEISKSTQAQSVDDDVSHKSVPSDEEERSAESQTSDDANVRFIDHFTTHKGGPFKTKTPAYLFEGRIYNSESSMMNCDHVLTSTKYKIITLCDGFGQKRVSKRVAETVAKTANMHLEDNIEACRTLRQVISEHVASVKAAQTKLEKEQHELQNEGTTLVQVSVSGDIVTGIAVGDSQVFAFIPKEQNEWDVVEMSGNGKNSLNPAKCGGRLSEDTSITATADLLTGLRVFAKKVPQKTVIFCCSDGVVDCFDPSIDLQKTPQDYGADEETWDILSSIHIPHVRVGICMNIADVIKGCISGHEIKERLLNEIATRVEDENMHMLIHGNKGYQPERVIGKPIGKPDNASCAYMVV